MQPLLILNRLACTDANENILHLGILLVQIMHIICGDQLHIKLASQLDQLGEHFFLLRNAMILKLDIKVISKCRLITLYSLPGLIVSAMQQMLRHLSAKARAEAYESLTVLFEHLPVDPWLIMKALEMTDRGQLHKIPVTRFILGQQY
ncbi:hypothetical protein D3C77_424180 [compost metagenome]